VIDFFTYCCINCLHVLPQLNAIDKLYQNEGLLVLGIHSPKFDNEKDVTNVGDAILKYDISHPIANDPLGKLWTSLSVQCWPTLVILGPNSQILFTLIGENGIQEWLQLYAKTALNYFKLKNMIITENKFKIPMKLLRNELKSELLEFPGKINASSDKQLLAISDTKHHNIIIAKINGFIKYMIGGNKSGFRDGSFTEALFNNPQGIVWKNNDILFVADTENHAIRMIDMNNKTVITLTGNGKQSYDRIGGNIGTDQGLNSPWDLCYDSNNRLFIAMAGSHQIWVLSLEDNTQILNKFYPKGCCFCFAGDGVEQNRNNTYPLKASFAQPSGLAFDSICNCLYVADSESSSVRCVDISTGAVKALVGGDKNPLNLFAFGDLDGKGIDCRLQHCLGIAYDSNTQSLFVADSYNHKVFKFYYFLNILIHSKSN
jgi:thiol-disulfide isomerase/thioredoxin